jgi:hypothetical protein
MTHSVNHRKWLALLLGLLVVFAALQFISPDRTNPPVKSDLIAAVVPPASIAASLHAACYDCHSFETRWPLYSRIAPVSWLIASDVKEGRRHLNLSDWPVDPARAAKQLDRINEVVDYREMPPKKYTLLHADARLTASQRQELLDWTDAEAKKLKSALPPG